MIQPDAKCINNGKKLNEAISALNSILDVAVSEEIEVVDTNNLPSKRWFFTGRLKGQKEDSASGDQERLGNTPSNNNRDQLTTGGRPLAPGSSVAPTVNISTGRPVADGSTAADSRAKFLAERNRAAGGSANMISVGGTGVDEFGNTIGGAGRPVADGSTAADSRAKFLAAKQGETTTPPPLPGAPPLGGDTTPPPLPGAPPLGGDTTPKPKRGQPSRATDTPFASQEIIDAKQWVPQKQGMPDIQELGRIVAAGDASQYQKDFYNNAVGNSLPITDGKINMQAISNNIKEGTATPYQQDFYNKAMGIDTPAGASAASGEDAPEDYYVDGIKAHVTEQGKNKPVLNRDRRKAKGPTRRRKQFSPIIEAQAVVKRLEDQLFKAKKEDKLKYDWNTNMWVYKKFGDPDSELVTSLKSRLKSAKARVKRMKKK